MIDQETAQIVERLAASLSYMLGAAGVSPEDFADALSRKSPHSSLTTDSNEQPPLNTDQVDFFSDLVTLWHREQEFVSDVGEPKSLPLKGSSGSFESLVRFTSDRHSIAPVFTSEHSLHVLLSHGTVQKNSVDEVVILDRAFIYGSSGTGLTMQLNRLAVFSETVSYNTRNGGGRFDRVASVVNLPREAVSQINAFLHDSGMHFLQQV